MYSYESPLQVYVELMLLGKYNDKILLNKIVSFPFFISLLHFMDFCFNFPIFLVVCHDMSLVYPLALLRNNLGPYLSSKHILCYNL